MIEGSIKLGDLSDEARDVLVQAVQEESEETLDFIERGLLVLGTQMVMKTEQNAHLSLLVLFAGELVEEMYDSAAGCEVDPAKIEAFRAALAEVV